MDSKRMSKGCTYNRICPPDIPLPTVCYPFASRLLSVRYPFAISSGKFFYDQTHHTWTNFNNDGNQNITVSGLMRIFPLILVGFDDSAFGRFCRFCPPPPDDGNLLPGYRRFFQLPPHIQT